MHCSSPPTCGSWEPLGKKTAQQQSASRLPNEISYCNLYTQANRVYSTEHQQMNDLKGQCHDIFDSLFCCCTYEQAKPFHEFCLFSQSYLIENLEFALWRKSRDTIALRPDSRIQIFHIFKKHVVYTVQYSIYLSFDKLNIYHQ